MKKYSITVPPSFWSHAGFEVRDAYTNTSRGPRYDCDSKGAALCVIDRVWEMADADDGSDGRAALIARAKIWANKQYEALGARPRY